MYENSMEEIYKAQNGNQEGNRLWYHILYGVPCTMYTI